MKFIITICTALFIFASCDVRRSDRVIDDRVQQMESAKRDTTSVTLIDSVFDFGTVKEGEKVVRNYRFRNTGNKPLAIVHASASCGCTVPETPQKPILPGQTDFIKVVFNSQGKKGHNDKTIVVVANTSPAFPTMQLKGEVVAAD